MDENERQARIAQLTSEITERVNELAQLAGDNPFSATIVAPDDFVGRDDLRSFCEEQDFAHGAGTRLWKLLIGTWYIPYSANPHQGMSLDVRTRGTMRSVISRPSPNEYLNLVISRESLKAVTATLTIGCAPNFGKTVYDLLNAWVAQL